MLQKGKKLVKKTHDRSPSSKIQQLQLSIIQPLADRETLIQGTKILLLQ